MAHAHHSFRFYYWISVAFLRKNLRPILLSAIISIFALVAVFASYPYILAAGTQKTKVVGVAGSYQINTLPSFILSQISSGLVIQNEKGEIIPALAQTIESRNDNKEYIVTLRKNLLFADSSKFTAQSVDYKFKDVQVETAKNAKGDEVVIFKLGTPLPIFPAFLTRPIVKYPLVGIAGAYSVTSSKIQQGIVKELRLAPTKSGDAPLVYKFYDTESKLIDAYKLGEIQEMSIKKKSVADVFKNWSNTVVSRTVDYSELLTLFFNVKNGNELLKEKDVRQAIAYCIPPKLTGERGAEAIGPIPPVSWAFNENINSALRSPETCAKILKNFTGDASAAAKLNLTTSFDLLDVADEIRGNLENAGFQVTTNTLTSTIQTQFDLLLAIWNVPQDPDQYFFWHSTQAGKGNISGYDNKRIDLLLEQGRGTPSATSRKKIYADFQKVIVDDTPAVFVYYPYTYTISRKR